MINSITDDLVNKFGAFFQTYNMNDIMGRIFGLLLLSTGPMSLDDISEGLKLSKASISIQVRKLEAIGYCKKLPKQKDRKDYYCYNEEFIRWTMLNFMAGKEKNQRAFERLVDEAEESTGAFTHIDQHQIVKDRLAQIREFNELFIDIIKASYRAWEERKKE